ncbi:hypothetical protein ES703_41910 [subsurface metagenome]
MLSSIFIAKTFIEISVGSPTTSVSFVPSFFLDTLELLQNMHTSKYFLILSLTSTTFPFSLIILPSIAYPTPSTLYSIPPTNTFTTVISFLVKVPVLSEQITLTLPNVSTAVNFLTKAFLSAIFFIPILITTVITTTRPSGTAETAKLIDISNATISSSKLNSVSNKIINSTAKTAKQITKISIPRSFPNLFTSF